MESPTPPERTLQVGVKVFLRDDRGRFLLVRRSTAKYPEVPATWDIPGGRITVGTPLFENLQREVQEETKLTITEPAKLLVAQDILRIPEKHVVRLTFTARVTGQPVLDEENDGYCWFTLDEMKRLPDLDEYSRGVIEQGHLDAI